MLIENAKLLLGEANCFGVAGLHLVGADVVEVAPAYDHAEVTAIAAATVIFDMITLLARSGPRRSAS